MRITTLIAGLALLSTGLAHAGPSTQVAWAPATLTFVKHGNAQHGQELANTCAGCHNSQTDFPNLEGQSANYLYRQLQDYKNGSRDNAIMKGLAATLSDQDMADLAAWFSHQKPAKGAGGESDPTGIASRGDGKRMEPPCSSCHGGSGQGQPVDTPRLAGQKEKYLRQTLLDYKSGARKNDLYSRMRLIASKLSDAEIQQLSAYYAMMD